MPRRSLALFLLLTLLLSACSAMLEGEFTHAAPHAAAEIPDTFVPLTAVPVENPEALEEALLAQVERGEIYGRLSFLGYDGDPETDLSAACLTVTTETPLGLYAVYYINYTLNQIVNHWEADISISYRRTGFELSPLVALDAAVREAMAAYRPALTFLLPTESLTQAAVDAAVDAVYYENPAVLYRPEAVLTLFETPERGSIAEIAFTYVYSRTEINQRLNTVGAAAEEVLRSLEETETAGDAALAALAQLLRERATYDEELEASGTYTRWYHAATAYGPLVTRTAIGEGYAMAYRLLCTRLGQEAEVVRGAKDGVSHTWNVVTLENGSRYHLDVAALTENASPWRTDREQEALGYTWPADTPPCNGPSLQTAPAAPESQEEPVEVV